MSTVMTFGGWVTDRPVATGDSPSFVRVVGWVAAAGVAALASVGTGGVLSVEQLQRTAINARYSAQVAEMTEIEFVRTPSENLSRIREVLNPAVSDLAMTFGVSRQSVYNWLNGEPVAEENAAKLQDLSQAADVLVHEGIAVDAALLKRKFASGRTLMQVARAGESARDAAVLLAQIRKREIAQRERMSARFANRMKSPATADFDLPAASDIVSR